MTRDDQLQNALDAIERGTSLKTVLADMDDTTRAELEPLLRLSLHIKTMPHPLPDDVATAKTSSNGRSSWFTRQVAAAALWLVMGGLVAIVGMSLLQTRPDDTATSSESTAALLPDYDQMNPVNTLQEGNLIRVQWSRNESRIAAVTLHELIIYTDTLRELQRWSLPTDSQIASLNYVDDNIFITTRSEGIYRASEDDAPNLFIDTTDLTAVAISDSNQYLAAIDRSETLYIWERDSGNVIEEMALTDTPENNVTPQRITFNNAGDRLAIASHSQGLSLWSVDADGVRLLHEWQPENTITDIAFAPDDESLLIMDNDEVMRQPFDSDTNPTPLTTTRGISLLAMHVVDDANILYLETQSQIIRYDIINDSRRSFVFPPSYGETAEITFSSDGRRFATRDRDHHLHVWTSTSGATVASFARIKPTLGIPTNIAAGTGTLAVVRTSDSVWLVDGRTGERTLLLEHDINRHVEIAFSPTDNLIAITVDEPNGAQLRFYRAQLTEPDLVAQFTLPVGSNLEGMAFHPDGQTLVTGGSEVRFWDISGETPTRTDAPINATDNLFEQEASYRVTWLAYSNNGHLLSAIGSDRSSDNNSLITWDTTTGNRLYTQSIDISPLFVGEPVITEQWLFTTYADSSDAQTLKMWNVRSGRLIDQIPYEQTISSLLPAPDGSHLLVNTVQSTGSAGNVYLHDLRDGNTLEPRQQLNTIPRGLAMQLSQDEQYVFVLAEQRQLQLFQMP